MAGARLFRRSRTLAVSSLAFVALGAVPVNASDVHDHDRARRAVEAGEVLPLRAILERVERDHPGQVMEVELEQRGDRWVYEIKVLKTGGALIKLQIDGRDGRVLDSTGQSEHGGRQRTER